LSVFGFCFFGWFDPGWFFCAVFAGLDFVWVFAESYYFVRLVVLKFILLVSALVLMEESAF
jgi:hypothetical protein